jgi:hypothetical protein
MSYPDGTTASTLIKAIKTLASPELVREFSREKVYNGNSELLSLSLSLN